MFVKSQSTTFTLSMRLPDPSRDPKRLLICGSRTPAGMSYSKEFRIPIFLGYRLYLGNSSTDKAIYMCEVPPNCVGGHSGVIL